MKFYPQIGALLIMLIGIPETQALSLPDPTKPPDLIISHAGTLELNQIIISTERKLAIINGKILHIGEILDDNKVIAINENTVELLGPNGKITLVLLSYPAKPINEPNGK